jgi:hypothetical protein
MIIVRVGSRRVYRLVMARNSPSGRPSVVGPVRKARKACA